MRRWEDEITPRHGIAAGLRLLPVQLVLLQLTDTSQRMQYDSDNIVLYIFESTDGVAGIRRVESVVIVDSLSGSQKRPNNVRASSCICGGR